MHVVLYIVIYASTKRRSSLAMAEDRATHAPVGHFEAKF